MDPFSTENIQDFKSLIARDIESGEVSKLLEYLTQVIEEMLRREPELLLSSLYRMDVSENAVHEVLEGKRGQVEKSLAELIIERQRVSLKTRKMFPQPKIEDPEASF
ncbi:MAG: hypothetical protein EA409_10140 [Saprospirales bacterium]|nr:MAG: hypothetical protein EA409_10140 [Saprospirales bacterium]